MNSNIPSMAATAGSMSMSANSSARPSPTSSVWWPPAPPITAGGSGSAPNPAPSQPQAQAQVHTQGQAPRRTTSTTRKPSAAATAALAPANLVASPSSPSGIAPGGTGQLSADARVRAVAAMGSQSSSPAPAYNPQAQPAFPPPRSQPLANPPTAAMAAASNGSTVHVYSSSPAAPGVPGRIATPPTPHMQHYPIHMQQHMYQHHHQQLPSSAVQASSQQQPPARPAVAVPQFSSQSSLLPPQHDDDADSDLGQPPSQPFTLPPGIRPSPSDFDTISRHLSLGRPGAAASAPAPATAGAPLTSDELRSMQADTHIQNGIQLHERLHLTESTQEFERAAHLGSATGMYLFGMALRSGWGVERDEKRAFEYLSRAADLALRQTSSSVSGAAAAALGKPGAAGAGGSEDQRAAAARELTLAIYELGQSFRNGWGVKKCRRTGAHYLQIAANLGDPDAQIDCGLAYLNGDGVKRDKMMAAKYFRLASNAGIEFPGNSWIWKDKYDVCGVVKKVKGGAAAAAAAK